MCSCGMKNCTCCGSDKKKWEGHKEQPRDQRKEHHHYEKNKEHHNGDKKKEHNNGDKKKW